MKQPVYLIFTLLTFAIFPSNSIELINVPEEIRALILDDKSNINNILSCNLINSHCYQIALKTSSYQQKLINKVEHVCNKDIQKIDFVYDFNKIKISDFVSEENKQKIKRYYQNMYPSFFIRNVLCCPKYNSGWVQSNDHSFNAFSRKYKILEKHESAVITDCVGFNYITWTLKTTGEKIVITDIEPNVIKDLLKENNDVWLKLLINDNNIVRIIFSNFSFNSRYVTFIANNIEFIELLQKYILYKPIIIQDAYGETLFHEACKNKELKIIKLYDPINLDVQDNNHNSPWLYALKHNNEEILQYLMEKKLEVGKLLSKTQFSKLSEELKEWYLQKIESYLAQRYYKH